MIKNKIVKYYARKDRNIAIKVINGHFVTTHSHLNYYLDMTKGLLQCYGKTYRYYCMP